MKEIEDYVDRVCKSLYLNSQEADEFKAEIREHLYDSAEEFKRRGYSEKRSAELALRRFGEERRIRAELSELPPKRAARRNSFLIAAFVFLGLSLLLFATSHTLSRERTLAFDGLTSNLVERLESAARTDGTLESGALADAFRQHERVLRYIQVVAADNAGGESIVYPSRLPSGSLDEQPYFAMPLSLGAVGSGGEMRVGLNGEYLFSPVPKLIASAALASFILYWACFGIGCTAYLRSVRTASAPWIVAFFAFNAIALLFFELALRRKIFVPAAAGSAER